MRADQSDPVAAAIIVAGGEASRFGIAGGKQLAQVAGAPVLTHTIIAFDRAARVGRIVVVCHPERVEEYREIAVDPAGCRTETLLVPGGASRPDSVRNGLAAVGSEWPVVAVHDGARPLVTPGLIDAAIEALLADEALDGVVVGHVSTDTLKRVDDGMVRGTVDRELVWAVQTPQVFRRRRLEEAYSLPVPASATDDASLFESIGGVAVLEGPRDNIKVTRQEDLAVVEALLSAREGGRT